MNAKGKKILLSVVIGILLIALVGCAILINQGKAKEYEDVSVSDEVVTNQVSTTKNSEYPFDVDKIAKSAYELAYIYSIDSFNSPKEIPVFQMVQYSFGHMYYDSLLDMPKNAKTELKTASADDINKSIKKEFNISGVDIKECELYNVGQNNFEMWLNNYYTDLTYTTEISETDNGAYVVKVNYSSATGFSSATGTKTVTVSKSGNNYYISKMS